MKTPKRQLDGRIGDTSRNRLGSDAARAGLFRDRDFGTHNRSGLVCSTEAIEIGNVGPHDCRGLLLGLAAGREECVRTMSLKRRN